MRVSSNRPDPFGLSPTEEGVGETGYPLRRMISFALDGITGFSMAPLRFCLALAGLSIAVALGRLFMEQKQRPLFVIVEEA